MSEEQRRCDARTARQASWGGSGCQRWAVTQVDGHWACKQHAEKPPPNGWKDHARYANQSYERGGGWWRTGGSSIRHVVDRTR